MATLYRISRRSFLRSSVLGAAAILTQRVPLVRGQLVSFPDAKKLGRICAGYEGARFDLKAEPYWDAQTTGVVYRDDVVVWLREVVTTRTDINRISQTWVETPQGFIYAPYVQPVLNIPNTPLEEIPDFGFSTKGMWVEVTVPYVDFRLVNNPQSPWLKETYKPRLYYSQIMWVDAVQRTESGSVEYRVSERYGSYGDVAWAAAEAFRIITPDEIKPIHPEVDDKHIEVNLAYQTLSCYEGKDEVYFCRVSTGYGDATPIGTIPTWRKMISTHMSGGTTGAGYDTPGVGWTVLFSSDGAAIHSTFWHNEFGLARTHGCVNALPDDAKWIFRWTSPSVVYDPGDITISGMNSSTKIIIREG